MKRAAQGEGGKWTIGINDGLIFTTLLLQPPNANYETIRRHPATLSMGLAISGKD